MWKNRRDKRKPVIEDFIEERTLHFYRIVDCRRWTSLQTYIRVLIVLQPRNRDMFLYFVQELFFRSRWYEYLRSFECDSNVDEKIGFLISLIWESTRLRKRARISTSITEEVTINIEKITYSHWLHTLARKNIRTWVDITYEDAGN